MIKQELLKILQNDLKYWNNEIRQDPTDYSWGRVVQLEECIDYLEKLDD